MGCKLYTVRKVLDAKYGNIVFLCLFGFIVRAVIFFVFYTHVTIFPDSEGYIELSDYVRNLNLSGYNGIRSPGYPLLLALAFGNLFMVVFYQQLLGVITSIVWYFTLQNFIFSKKESLVITVFLQTFLNIYFYETAILMESFVLFMISIIVYFLTRSGLSFLKLMLLSFLVGYLVFTKSFYVYFPFLIYIFYLIRNNQTRKEWFKGLVIFVFPVLFYFGWCYVNKINTGYFTSSTMMGIYMSQNCVRFAENTSEDYQWLAKPYVEYREKSIKEDRDLAMAIWYAYNSGAYGQYEMNLPDFSNQLKNYAVYTIKSNIWNYLSQVVFHSWRDFWKPGIHWNYKDFNFRHANKLFAGVWYVQFVVLLSFRLMFLFLSPYLILKAIKNRQFSYDVMLIIMILATSVLQALITYGSNSRFSFPFEYLMIVVVLMFFKERKIGLFNPIAVSKIKLF